MQGWCVYKTLQELGTCLPVHLLATAVAIKFHHFQQANHLQACFCALLGRVMTNWNGVNECTSQQQTIIRTTSQRKRGIEVRIIWGWAGPRERFWTIHTSAVYDTHQFRTDGFGGVKDLYGDDIFECRRCGSAHDSLQNPGELRASSLPEIYERGRAVPAWCGDSNGWRYQMPMIPASFERLSRLSRSRWGFSDRQLELISIGLELERLRGFP